MSKTTNRFSPEVRVRAVLLVLDHADQHPSRWAAVMSIAPSTYRDHVAKRRDPARLSDRARRTEALEQALHDRQLVHRGGLVHHSDRGRQYISIKYTEHLAEAGVEP